MTSINYVLLEPEELVFHNVRLSQVYTQQLRITNTLRGPLELTVKPGSVERYTITPSSLRLRSEESALVEVRLRVLRFAQKQKAVEQGHRDVFHIKVRYADSSSTRLQNCWAQDAHTRGPQQSCPSTPRPGFLQGSHFDQKFYATFFLQPDADYVPKGRSGAAAAVGTRVGPQARASGRDASRSRYLASKLHACLARQCITVSMRVVLQSCCCTPVDACSRPCLVPGHQAAPLFGNGRYQPSPSASQTSCPAAAVEAATPQPQLSSHAHAAQAGPRMGPRAGTMRHCGTAPRPTSEGACGRRCRA